MLWFLVDASTYASKSVLSHYYSHYGASFTIVASAVGWGGSAVITYNGCSTTSVIAQSYTSFWFRHRWFFRVQCGRRKDSTTTKLVMLQSINTQHQSALETRTWSRNVGLIRCIINRCIVPWFNDVYPWQFVWWLHTLRSSNSQHLRQTHSIQ